jgi:rRNA maturation RNase YbeY
MSVLLRNFQSKVKINEDLLKMHCCFLLQCLGVTPYDVSIVCVSTNKIKNFNKTYRNKDTPTDILSFPYHEITTPGMLPTPLCKEDCNLGDIIIGLPYVNEQCINDNTPLHHHLPILLTHGLCHLLGYTHYTPAGMQQMYNKENSMLRCFNNAFGLSLKPLTAMKLL